MEVTFCPSEVAWGDVGTWVSGVGTWVAILFAMLVPLALLGYELHRSRTRTKFRAELAAIASAPSLKDAHVSLLLLRETVLVHRMELLLDQSGVQLAAQVLQIKCELPSEDEALNLERPLAVAITNLRTTLRVYNAWIRESAEVFPKVEGGHPYLNTPKFTEFHDAIDRELRQLATVLGPFLVKPIDLPQAYQWAHPFPAE